MLNLDGVFKSTSTNPNGKMVRASKHMVFNFNHDIEVN